MNEEQENNYSPTPELSDRQIFTNIWTKPRMVFRYIIDNNYQQYFYVLLFLAGVTSAFDRAANKGMGDDQSLAFIVLLSIILGGALGWISFYIGAGLLSWTGKWIGGKANMEHLFKMAAYASMPVICSLPIIIIQIVIFGNDIFKSEIYLENYTLVENIIYYASALVEFTVAIWAICIYVVGLSEIQEFSIEKAIGNVFIAFGVIFIPIMLLVLLFTGLG